MEILQNVIINVLINSLNYQNSEYSSKYSICNIDRTILEKDKFKASSRARNAELISHQKNTAFYSILPGWSTLKNQLNRCENVSEPRNL